MLLLPCALCITAQAHGVTLADIGGGGPQAAWEAVARGLQQYLRVTDAMNSQAIGRALHGQAPVASVTTNGALRSMAQDEWWERAARIPEATPARRSQPRAVGVIVVAAVATIEIGDEQPRSFSDLFTLHKTWAAWRVVFKVLPVDP
jgi:hypothetical protein